MARDVTSSFTSAAAGRPGAPTSPLYGTCVSSVFHPVHHGGRRCRGHSSFGDSRVSACTRSHCSQTEGNDWRLSSVKYLVRSERSGTVGQGAEMMGYNTHSWWEVEGETDVDCDMHATAAVRRSRNASADASKCGHACLQHTASSKVL
ncbi:hypothetical protein FHG87_003435 [Trinorchestia longiramus]|nr:hypothetical protein FHG87_003435 [Trinorchestia longiramus]